MDGSKVTAILGPTNTGKTHLAVERMCAHSSGIMGFPLRLLAREIYDRVVKVKGEANVALITGEERIAPPDARWLLCTTESIPMERDVAFMAIDEVQLGADTERGHIFTDRLLNARGREETMLLGSESLRPAIRALIPKAEIITRPRFSKLSFAPPKKLSRLPPRSAIVAFSVEQVYEIAEMLRQSKGGAAVVMGALSPRTRNAQVKMYQDGEVDYLVATDAIGMGLNMDVTNIYFASLTKFDGRRQRRLSVAEMAQIAGRAGRHQRDGAFGTLTAGDMFTPEEIDAIENHRFPRLDHLYWRNAEPDFGSLGALIDSLEMNPQHRMLRAAPDGEDLTILKILAAEPETQRIVGSEANLARLWDVCRLPDFQKLGAEFHARFLSRVFHYLTSGSGYVSEHLFADQIARLDVIQGDVSTIAARIAVVRTWAYIAQRADWLEHPVKWRQRAAEVEERLSDALHAKLTERFVDRRTKMLMHNAATPVSQLRVEVDDSGEVFVENQLIGTLDGFSFATDPSAPLVDRKRLIAGAEKHLARELARRAGALIDAPDKDFTFSFVAGETPYCLWQSHPVATLKKGKDLLHPALVMNPSIRQLDPKLAAMITKRVARWLTSRIEQQLRPLFAMAQAITGVNTSVSFRTIVASMIDSGGMVERHLVEESVALLDHFDRKQLRTLGIIIGTLDIFHPALIKPEAAKLRVALHRIRARQPMLAPPMAGLGLLDRPTQPLAIAAKISGYRSFSTQMLRIDLVERIARKIHEQRAGKLPFVPDTQLATSLGIGEGTLFEILLALGFKHLTVDTITKWRWHGPKKPRQSSSTAQNPAFSALAAWKKHRSF